MEANLQYNETTPIWQLTVGQFLSLMDSRNPHENTVKKSPERRYVKGLHGIISLFGCSKPTAMKLKNTIIKDAVSQNGRVIITDAEKAIQLFKEYQETHTFVPKIPSTL